MPMNEYKIVNATQLDADLASIANMIKTKTQETHDYVFPEDFVTSIEKMSYNNIIFGEKDLIVEDNTVIVPMGYYSEEVRKSIDEGEIHLNNIEIEENPIIKISEDGSAIESEYRVEKSLEFSINPGYISTFSNENPIVVSGKTIIPLGNIFEIKDQNFIINNGNGTITIPAGYYAEDVVFTLPVEEAPEDEISENEEPIE